mgnify:CR=1 FL=1
MSTPEILWPALRQYRHNSDNSPSLLDPEEGFVAAFDYDNTLAIVATLQSDLAAASAELARAKPALIKAWEIFFTRSFSQDPIGRAEARYAREIAHKGEEVGNE